ncbi:hypothetical protein BDFB_005404, partial [Asbolus verrucosus]
MAVLRVSALFLLEMRMRGRFFCQLLVVVPKKIKMDSRFSRSLFGYGSPGSGLLSCLPTFRLRYSEDVSCSCMVVY